MYDVKIKGLKLDQLLVQDRRLTNQQDDNFERELLNDPKEIAEHIMLVDLGRNDIGRVCDYKSIEVPEFMVIERYSHVMHIVSNVVGTLRKDKNIYDVMKGTFPAGTVSGAPKVRAMEIISELEKSKRVHTLELLDILDLTEF